MRHCPLSYQGIHVATCTWYLHTSCTNGGGYLYSTEGNNGMERWNGMEWWNDHAHRACFVTTYTDYIERHASLLKFYSIKSEAVIALMKPSNVQCMYMIWDPKSRLAIRVLNYCRARVNAKRLNDVTLMKARGCIACTLSGY